MFQQMLQFLVFLLLGFLLVRLRILSPNTSEILSKLAGFVLIPALILSTFSTRCTPQSLRQYWPSMLICALLIALSCSIAALIVRSSKGGLYWKGIFRYSLIIPNYGYMGIALVSGVFGADMLFRYMLYYLPLTVFGQAIAVCWLFPPEECAENAKRSLKSRLRTLANPITISVVVGILVGLLEIPLPSFLSGALSSLASCMSPIGMLVIGFLIGKFDFRLLFKQPLAYGVSLYRLLLFPSLAMLLLILFGVDDQVRLLSLCCFAMPVGMNTVIIPAANGYSDSTSTSIVLISHLLSVITVPLMFALWIGA